MDVNILIYIAVLVGVLYAALFPWYKKNAEMMATEGQMVKFAKKYILTIIINLVLNIFVVMLAVDAFIQQMPLNGGVTLFGLLFAAFVWGVQSQKTVNIFADYLEAAVNKPSPVVLPPK